MEGLGGDLAKLCAASGVSAAIDLAAVPLSAAARVLVANRNADIETVVSGGDDYEVLCTVPENRWESFAAAARHANVDITSIGKVEAGTAAPRFLDATGQPITLKRLSYSHF